MLVDQKVIAGIGNALKSEILFVAQINPFVAAASLGNEAAGRLVETAVELMRANVLEPAPSLNVAFGRRATRGTNPLAQLWVYGRAGRPCRQCGAPIASKKTGLDARATYWCPRCQSTK